MVKKKQIYVGDLGEAKFLKMGFKPTAKIKKNPLAVLVNYVLEEDGTKSWQLNIERSDTLLKEAWVEPLEADVRKEIREQQKLKKVI